MKLSDRVEGDVVILEPKGKIMGGPDASLLHDKLYEYIDTLYWLGDRTIAPTDYNINIFDYLAQVNEEDYE